MQVLEEAVKRCELPSSYIVSSMKFKYISDATYNQMTKFYDESISLQLKSKGFLDQKIVLIQVTLQPENMTWIIWKNADEITNFIQAFKDEIDLMNKVPQRVLSQGNQITLQHGILSREYIFTKQGNQRFLNFLNMVGSHLFLRKSISFLIFIGHCISIDKWGVMIHHQDYIYKPLDVADKFIGLFTKQEKKRNKDYFITVTADGILKSDDHLLLSRVEKMIPFTNQMNITCKLDENENMIYQITSGRIQKMILNFYKDYINGTNFGCGLKRALKLSGYNFLGGISLEDLNSPFSAQQKSFAHRFQSFAQKRTNSNVKMYNDGCGYFEDLYTELMKAQKQVCITGWMITPYFLLKRPGTITDPQYRLDGVLHKIANRGVKVFIIVFMEPALFVNNDSEFVQTHMEQLHKNIKVYRHPNVAVPQLWSHHQKLVVIDQKIGFMGGLDICYGRWDTPQHLLIDNNQKKFWDGCDFNNYKISDIYAPRNFNQSNLNPAFQPRMPWHDIAVQIRGDVVIDLLRHFVQYWYFVRSQLSTDPRKLFGLIQKRFDQASNYYQKVQKQYLLQQIKKDTEETFQKKFNQFKGKIGVLFGGEQERLSELLIQSRTGMNQGDLNIQMLRSASEWSIGISPGRHQSSIHNAYVDLIVNSQKFIYIENQFFMGLENRIVQNLADRIIKAHKNNQKFRVMVVMPLLPGFQGDVTNPLSTVLRIQVHWQFQAINRNKEKSLHVRLKKGGLTENDIDKYIFFFGLRTAQLLNKVPITQIVYVHSKLMIVDDKRTIIGSANINDRSLLGNRDSQIAICVEEVGQTRPSFTLRSNLFKEHFGLDVKKNDNIDLSNDQVWSNIINQAKKNTLIYRQIFGCIPDDNVTVGSQAQGFQQKANILLWDQLNSGIKGHAVQFPLKFMQNEDLTFKPNQKQYYAPDHSFT